MRVYRSLTEARGRESRCVVAVGNFDGVHRGHQAVFGKAAAEAAGMGSPALVLTFSYHPILTLSPQSAPSPLMTVKDRLAFAGALGADAALVLPFEGDLAAEPGELLLYFSGARHRVLVNPPR